MGLLALTPTARWRGEDAELLHQAEHVGFDPPVNYLAIHNAVDISAGHGRCRPRRWDTLEHTGVLGLIGIVDDHHLAFCDEELGRDLEIEGSEVGAEQLLERLAASDWTWGTDDVADVVRGAKFVDEV